MLLVDWQCGLEAACRGSLLGRTAMLQPAKKQPNVIYREQDVPMREVSSIHGEGVQGPNILLLC